MHNNYYFLRQLSHALEKELAGFTLVSCFSQNKDELVLEFNNSTRSFFIKASLQPGFQCLSFPQAFHRAKKNSVDLFSDLLMKRIVGVRQFKNERSFGIELEDSFTLVFKMHGARANVIVFKDNSVREIFRNNFTADMELVSGELDREIDWSRENLEKNRLRLPEVYFTFGKPIWSYLRSHGFESMEKDDQWNLIQRTLQHLEKPSYSIIDQQGVVSLTILPTQDILKTFQEPIGAINDFFIRHISTSEFQKEKSAILSHVAGKLKQAESFLFKTRDKLRELQQDVHYQQWADLIMANLNNIKQGQEKTEVKNFYDHDNRMEIKLKPDLSPQKNAEVYYRKAKNQSIELNTLKDSVERKEKEVSALNVLKGEAESANALPILRALSSALVKNTPTQREQVSLPYHEFEHKGFRIWVGKNAAANDTLTLKFSFKDDLWLHAKDVPGSHVLIKYQSGKPFPKDVIEHAAQLAAFYSKRKNESLCPVAVTPKKFVRKRKGDPAGSVIVEREDVILVEPARGVKHNG